MRPRLDQVLRVVEVAVAARGRQRNQPATHTRAGARETVGGDCTRIAGVARRWGGRIRLLRARVARGLGGHIGVRGAGSSCLTIGAVCRSRRLHASQSFLRLSRP